MKLINFTLILVFMSIASYGQGYDGLIGRWPFNGNADDVSGHGLNGVVTNATQDAGYNGQPNTAYSFDGVSSYITIPYDSLLNVTNFSICTLVNPDTFYSGPCQISAIIYRDKTGPVTDHYGIQLYDNDYDDDCNVYSPDHEVFATEGNNWNSAPNSAWIDTAVLTHHWYCVVAEGNGDSVFLYVNGSLRKSLPTNGPLTSSTSDLVIGTENPFDSDYPYWFHGKIDEMRLYNRVLSASEVDRFCDSATMLRPNEVSVVTPTADVQIYPNPTHGNIKVHFSQAGLTGSTQLINALGQVILSKEINGSDMFVNMDGLPEGFYYIKCLYNGKTTVQKVIKQ